MAQSFSPLLIWLVCAPLFGAVLNGFLGRDLPRSWVSVIGCLSVFTSFALGIYLSMPIFFSGGEMVVVQDVFSWLRIDNLSLPLSLVLDSLSVVMVLVITGVGFLIHLYSTVYMHDDDGYWCYFAYLNLFVFSMLMLVLGGNLPVMFMGWEGVGLCSYLLIGFWYEDPEKAAAGKKAFIVNRIGDAGFLLAMFLLFSLAGSLAFADLRVAVSAGAVAPMAATAICLLLFLGATGKSAQIPLYIWLPDAMAGPTPVSALIHAATMVTAGVYMVARLSFLFAISPTASAVIALVGGLTAFMAATIGVVQTDIKKVLAYSTVSQLGYMFIGVGTAGYVAGVFHLMTHAFFKACLFLGAGAVIHALSGEQDIRKMGGLYKKLPWTYVSFLLATFAIAGVPPFSGFFSKDEIIWRAFSTHSLAGWAGGWLHPLVGVLSVMGAFLTSFYMFRLLMAVFHGRSRLDPSVHVHHESKLMSAVLAILALLSLAGGWINIPHHLTLLEGFLHPLIGAAEQSAVSYVSSVISLSESGLIGINVTLLIIGFSLAYLIYIKRDAFVRRQEKEKSFAADLLYRAYRVDDFYALIFVRPLARLSTGLWRFCDEKIIDGFLVGGTVWVAQKFGDVTKRMQSGDVQYYLFWFFAGVVLVFTYKILTPG